MWWSGAENQTVQCHSRSFWADPHTSDLWLDQTSWLLAICPAFEKHDPTTAFCFSAESPLNTCHILTKRLHAVRNAMQSWQTDHKCSWDNSSRKRVAVFVQYIASLYPIYNSTDTTIDCRNWSLIGDDKPARTRLWPCTSKHKQHWQHWLKQFCLQLQHQMRQHVWQTALGFYNSVVCTQFKKT